MLLFQNPAKIRYLLKVCNQKSSKAVTHRCSVSAPQTVSTGPEHSYSQMVLYPRQQWNNQLSQDLTSIQIVLGSPKIMTNQCQEEVGIDNYITPFSFISSKRLGCWVSDTGQMTEVHILCRKVDLASRLSHHPMGPKPGKLHPLSWTSQPRGCFPSPELPQEALFRHFGSLFLFSLLFSFSSCSSCFPPHRDFLPRPPFLGPVNSPEVFPIKQPLYVTSPAEK